MESLQTFGAGVILVLGLVMLCFTVAIVIQLFRAGLRLARRPRSEVLEARRIELLTIELMRDGFTEREAQDAARDARA